MKTKLILIFFSFLFISCVPDDEQEARFGIKFEIINKTSLEYSNVKVNIGGLQDGTFFGTDFYSLPTIRIRDNASDIQYAATDYNRWRPNLDLIKGISDKAYFTVQLTGKEPVLLYDTFDDTKIISAQITENGVVKDYYAIILTIRIYDSYIDASLYDEFE